jgi:hypothetical protein
LAFQNIASLEIGAGASRATPIVFQFLTEQYRRRKRAEQSQFNN